MYERFITLEGGEGAGKTTALNTIERVLESKGLSYVLTREPGGTIPGERIREFLLDPQTGELQPETELLMMQAARSESICRVVKPALTEGKIVVSDRFDLSSLAYQGGGRGYEHTQEMVFAQRERLGVVLGLTVFLDVDPNVGRERAKQRGAPDRFEKEKLEFANRVREKFLEYARADSTIKTIDTNKDLRTVQSSVERVISTYLDSINL